MWRPIRAPRHSSTAKGASVKLQGLGPHAFLPDALEPDEPDKSTSAAELRPELEMRLWALDARVADAAVLTDRERLRVILYGAAQLGGATVVEEEFCVFANGAVTGVLVLAQSHLSIHTWPEHSLANVDLLSCGDLPGELMLRWVGQQLDAEHFTITSVPRGPWS
jgi:S-adenosylmethionine decarboxylase